MKDADGIKKENKSFQEEEDKEETSYSYVSPIFETNRENNTKFSYSSTYRSDRDLKGDNEAPITIRKKVGEQVFLGEYYHARLSKDGKILLKSPFEK